jgi:hypothetical protein
MPDLDLNAIKARAEAVTPGPWTAGGSFTHPWEVCIAADVPFVELDATRQGGIDAKFIAHAREDVPAGPAEDCLCADDRAEAGGDLCGHCTRPWPCPTAVYVRAQDGGAS